MNTIRVALAQINPVVGDIAGNEARIRESIRQARDAGVDWFVVASAIFDKPDRAAAIRELRQRLK